MGFLSSDRRQKAREAVFRIDSEEGKGTEVKAVFVLSHIDRMPLGDISSTIHTLIVFNERIEFRYTYRYGEKSFVLDTGEMREILGEEISFAEPEVSAFIRKYLEKIKRIRTEELRSEYQINAGQRNGPRTAVPVKMITEMEVIHEITGGITRNQSKNAGKSRSARRE